MYGRKGPIHVHVLVLGSVKCRILVKPICDMLARLLCIKSDSTLDQVSQSYQRSHTALTRSNHPHCTGHYLRLLSLLS